MLQRGDVDDPALRPPGSWRWNGARRRGTSPVRLTSRRLAPDAVRRLGEQRGASAPRPRRPARERARHPGPAKSARPRRPGSRRWAPAWPRRPRAGCGRRRRRGLRGPGRPARRERPPRLRPSAVAAPIPRLAPVTTATRPASQCTGSPPAIGTSHLPVEPLVSVQAHVQVEVPLGVVAAGRPRNPGRPPDGSTAAWMSSGGTRKPVTPSAITSLRPRAGTRPRESARTPAPRRRPSRRVRPTRPDTTPPPRGPSPPTARSWALPRAPSPLASLVAGRSAPGCTRHHRRRRRRRSALRPRRRCRWPRPRPSPGSAGPRTARPARRPPTRG